MQTQSKNKRVVAAGFVGLAVAILLPGADEPKQTIDARGLTFDAPSNWKSSLPSSQMRRAQLKVEPLEGDDYPAELVVFAFPGGAGSVDDNLKRWQRLFKDKDGNPPNIDSKTVKGKNVDVTRAETSGHYYPAQFGGRPEPDRPDARLLGAIVMGDEVSYYIRMVGPNKTMTKIRPAFDEMLATIKLGEK
jgi:hypothetical protein